MRLATCGGGRITRGHIECRQSSKFSGRYLPTPILREQANGTTTHRDTERLEHAAQKHIHGNCRSAFPARVALNPPTSGQLGRFRAKHGRSRPTFGRCWPISSRICPTMDHNLETVWGSTRLGALGKSIVAGERPEHGQNGCPEICYSDENRCRVRNLSILMASSGPGQRPERGGPEQDGRNKTKGHTRGTKTPAPARFRLPSSPASAACARTRLPMLWRNPRTSRPGPMHWRHQRLTDGGGEEPP